MREPGRPATACRPPGIADGLILVAAVAAALAALRFSWPEFATSNSYGVYPMAVDLLDRVSWTSMWATSTLLIAGTIAYLLIRMRRPRPGRRRLARQPGFVGCGAAAVLWTPMIPGLAYQDVRQINVSYVMDFAMASQDYSGPAVAGAWAALWLGGRWRREPGWIDGMGTCLGCGWLANFLLAQAQMI